jgi:hypothetical protein
MAWCAVRLSSKSVCWTQYLSAQHRQKVHQRKLDEGECGNATLLLHAAV